MIRIVSLLILASFTSPRLAPPLKQPTTLTSRKHSSGGRWYMAEDGHAVFCYGPKMMVQNAEGGIDTVVTFCSDGKTIVKLHD